MSYAFRVNYNYKGRYLLHILKPLGRCQLVLRRQQVGFVPAGAVAWRISEESLEDTRSWLDNAKLRVSYGITGNSGGTGAYVTQSQAYLYPNAGVTVGGVPVQFAQYTGTFAGSDLGWEKIIQLERRP